MKRSVSRERARKTRQRHKQAIRTNQAAATARTRPLVTGFLGLLVWALVFIALPILFRPVPIGDLLALLPILLADAVIGLVLLITVTWFLMIVAPGMLARHSRAVLMSLICLFSALCGALILSTYPLMPTTAGPYAHLLPLALPFVLAPLLAALLLGPQAALACGIVSSVILATYAARSFPLLIGGLAVTMVISRYAPRARTRARAARVALFAGFVQWAAVGIIALTANGIPSPAGLLAMMAACIASALLCALIALLVLPLLEHTFNLTSDISLLEFSDLGHPLLQRLAIEAPGTYHHSLIVANIVQAAAEAIGANSLEARVSAYFHDIGKLTKPGFFAENMRPDDNPHDKLAPSMSTLIITSHVKEGISLAMLHKLPECVHRAILEHHGSSVLQCFHHKALTQQLELHIEQQAPTPVDEAPFRYPGPRPTTKVSAIICLADGVEAASRTLEKPTPGHLEDLVNDIVRRRLDDGQLDDCELSLLELSCIRRAFVFTLANMLHGRVAYPNHEYRDPKSTKAGPGGPEGGSGNRAPDPAMGTPA